LCLQFPDQWPAPVLKMKISPCYVSVISLVND
jgi:hypothetical protein